MQPSKISLEFQYSEAEYLAASRLLFFSTTNLLVRLVVFGLLMVGGALAFGLLLSESLIMWVTLLFVALLEGVLFYNALVVIPRKYFRGDAKFHERYQLAFSDEGVKAKTSQIDSKLAWSLYTKVVEGRDMYVLLYGQDTRMMTAVPKRVFVNKDQENRFRELVARHITAHSGLKQIPPSESEYTPSNLTPPDWR
jgi:YcxB-like protein